MSRARPPAAAATVAQLTSTAPNSGPGSWRVYLVHDDHRLPPRCHVLTSTATNGGLGSWRVYPVHDGRRPLAGFLASVLRSVITRAVLRRWLGSNSVGATVLWERRGRGVPRPLVAYRAMRSSSLMTRWVACSPPASSSRRIGPVLSWSSHAACAGT